MNQSGHTAGDGDQPEGDQPKATQASRFRLASRHYAATAKHKYEVASKYIRKAPQAIFWLLGWIWRGTGGVVKRLDSHNGLLTAAATFAIAVLTYYVVQFTAEQGQITNRQLTIMEADQRPWIKTEISFASDLTYSETRMSVTFHFALKNVGRSPALNVDGFPSLRPTILFPALTGYIDLLEPMKEIRKYCDDFSSDLAKLTRSAPWGAIVYPGETFEKDEAASIDIADIKRTLPAFNPAVIAKPEPAAPILMLSCIDYQANLESRHHQTADFSILSSRTSTDKNSFSDIDPRDRKPVAKETLILREAAIYGSKYAN